METKNTIQNNSGDFTLLFNLSQDILCMVNSDGSILKVNEKLSEATGFKATDLPCSSLIYLLHPEDYHPILNLIKSAVPGIDFSFETSFLCNDNTYKNISCRAVKNQDGLTIITAKIVTSVITVSQNQEEITLLNERRFKALVQGGSDFLSILSADGNFTYVSPTALHILGNDPAFYIGKNKLSFIHANEREYLSEIIENISKNYRLELKPYRFSDSNGKWHWMETVVTNLLHDSAVNGIVFNSKDITIRTQIENERFHLSQRLNNLIENNNDALFTLNEDGNITSLNSIFQNIRQLPYEDLLYANIWDIFPLWKNLKFFTEFSRCFTDKIPVHFEEYSGCCDMWFDVTAYPYDNTITVFLKNISELKNQQLTLALEKEVLEMNISSKFSLKQTIDHLLKGIENIHSGMICSVLQLDFAGKQLYHLSGPSLPDEFTKAMNGIRIGPEAGPCGTAAYLKERVIVADTGNHSYWKSNKGMALPLGLKSCWSFPVINPSDQVIATLGIYSPMVKEPSDIEIKSLDRVSTIIQLLIESSKNKTELEISNERYRLTIQATSDNIWDLDIQNNILYRGNGFGKYHDQEAGFEDVKLRKWELNIHPDDVLRVESSLENSLKKKSATNWTEEYRYLKKDGSYAVVIDKALIVRDVKGTAIRIVGAMQDVSELTSNVEELRKSEENYKRLFSQNPTPLWIYELKTKKFLMVNDAALDLYGYTRKEFLRLNLFSIRAKEEYAFLRNQLASPALYDDKTIVGEWKYRKKDQSIFIASVVSNFMEIDGQLSRLVAIIDITEQKNSELKIIEQNKRLREIAQISSHEFRKPVATILGLVKLFNKEIPNSKLNSEIIDYLDTTAQQLDEVIHTIVEKTWKEEN